MSTTDDTCTTAPQQMPEFPKPQTEHDWLQQFVGDWTSEAECFMAPDAPPVINKGTERIRSIGGFWITVEIEAGMGGFPFHALQTIGFDPKRDCYIATWVDSMTSYLWHYEGSVNEAGTKLTIHSEAPCPLSPGRLTKFRDELEIIDGDHKTYTSAMQGEDGEWRTCLKAKSVRKRP